ncbi:MAG: CopD family protein [Formivibrio sp.]|nr:CopD family protein [Formivibrio sp.]
MTFPILLPDYRLLLAGHVSAVILWMAGMLILPSIYAEHSTLQANDRGHGHFVAIERVVIKGLVNPAMYAAWGFGALLIVTPGTMSWHARWWQIKFAAVFVLSAYHGVLSMWRRHLHHGTNRHKKNFYHAMTAVPIFLVILVVTMVMVKPH